MTEALDLLADPVAVDAIGWLAAGAVLLTFCMKTMQALRMVAVLSNVAFVAYALAAGLTPVLVLHAALLPLNLARLLQLRIQLRRIAEAGRGDPASAGFHWLAELGEPRRLAAGETLFRKGDPARSLFVLVSGEVILPEIDVRLGPGALIGEVGVFSSDARRTATVRATVETHLAEVTDSRVHQLHFDNPKFAWRLIRLVTARLVGNVRRTEAEASARIARADARAEAAEARAAAIEAEMLFAAHQPEAAGDGAAHGH